MDESVAKNEDHPEYTPVCKWPTSFRSCRDTDKYMMTSREIAAKLLLHQLALEEKKYLIDT